MSSGPSLGEAILYLVGDSTQLDKDVDNAKTKTSKTLSSIGGSLQKTGGIMTAAITAPLGIAATQMIEDASDMNETVSKIGVVFEDQSASILAFGETSAQALGMSTNEALAAAGTYGNLFRAMEIGTETSADMSINLVGLAGDLASFNNMEPGIVLDKLRAGLSGETEPLKSLGVNINQALIQEKAFELGLWDGVGTLDAAAKAQASYALIMEQTSLAQGDFARTSDGLANSQRIMKAELANASAELGTQLLPLALKAVKAITGLVEKFTSMSPAGQKVILIIGGIAAAIGPLIMIIGTVLQVVGGLMTFLAGPAVVAIGAAMAPVLPIIGIIAAIIAVVGLLFAAWKNNWFGIRDITANVIGSIVDFWNNKFIPAIKSVADFLGKVLGGAFNAVKNAIMGVWDWIQKLAGALTNIKLPDWMTPGSPTPWEIGLRGISDAMSELDGEMLPGLAGALGNLNAGAMAGSTGQGMPGMNIGGAQSKNISFTINNPVGETTDQSMRRGLSRLQYLGMA